MAWSGFRGDPLMSVLPLSLFSLYDIYYIYHDIYVHLSILNCACFCISALRPVLQLPMCLVKNKTDIVCFSTGFRYTQFTCLLVPPSLPFFCRPLLLFSCRQSYNCPSASPQSPPSACRLSNRHGICSSLTS